LHDAIDDGPGLKLDRSALGAEAGEHEGERARVLAFIEAAGFLPHGVVGGGDARVGVAGDDGRADGVGGRDGEWEKKLLALAAAVGVAGIHAGVWFLRSNSRTVGLHPILEVQPKT